MSATPAAAIIRRLDAFTRYMSQDFLGGPRVVKMATVINLQKGATFLWGLGLIWYYQKFSAAAWT